MEIDFHAILYYMERGYKVTIDELIGLKEEEFYELILRYPYRMSVIMKYGKSDHYFDGRYRLMPNNNCYHCGKTIYNSSDLYEVSLKMKLTLEAFCRKCWKKRYRSLLASREALLN